jgi:hypothetical protein
LDHENHGRSGRLQELASKSATTSDIHANYEARWLSPEKYDEFWVVRNLVTFPFWEDGLFAIKTVVPRSNHHGRNSRNASFSVGSQSMD